MSKNRLRLAGVLTAVLSASSCSLDLFGFFWSESDPDHRFAESRAMIQPPSPTSTVAPDESDFTFLFLSDTHIRDGKHTLLQNLAAGGTGADFVVVGGDITQNGRRADFDAFLEIASTFGIPVYPLIGNHDLYSGGWSEWRKVMGPTSYSVEIGSDALLVCLDTGNVSLGQNQYRWLDGVLASGTGKTLIVVTHAQLFTNDAFEIQQMTFLEETALLLRMFERRGVALFLAGHSHRYDSKKLGDLQYYVSGSFQDDAHAEYLRVTVTGGVPAVQRISFP